VGDLITRGWTHRGFVQRAMGEDVRRCHRGRVLRTAASCPLMWRRCTAMCGRSAAAASPGAGGAGRDTLRIKPYAAWYRTWHEGMVAAPYYAVNSRE
jgi:hypothetical protein